MPGLIVWIPITRAPKGEQHMQPEIRWFLYLYISTLSYDRNSSYHVVSFYKGKRRRTCTNYNVQCSVCLCVCVNLTCLPRCWIVLLRGCQSQMICWFKAWNENLLLPSLSPVCSPTKYSKISNLQSYTQTMGSSLSSDMPFVRGAPCLSAVIKVGIL